MQDQGPGYNRVFNIEVLVFCVMVVQIVQVIDQLI